MAPGDQSVCVGLKECGGAAHTKSNRQLAGTESAAFTDPVTEVDH